MTVTYDKIKSLLLNDGFKIINGIWDFDDKVKIGYRFWCDHFWEHEDEKYGKWTSSYSIDFNIFELPESQNIVFQLKSGKRKVVQQCISLHELDMILNNSYVEPIIVIRDILQRLMNMMEINVKFWEGDYKIGSPFKK